MKNSSNKPTERFSSRVENYVRYRPHYPDEVIDRLRHRCDLSAASVVADVGSGTGILSELFLRNDNPLFGVEPNREMREAGERLLHKYPNFTSVDGTAEATTLQNASVDFVTAGQAFHWFDREQARVEFRRILRPNGWVVLIWNERRETTTPFARDYETLLQRFATDYTAVNHRNIDVQSLQQFFQRDFAVDSIENSQHFDFEGLQGRLLSSSYAPESGHARHDEMIAELRRLFELHQVASRVTIEYDTNIYSGRV